MKKKLKIVELTATELDAHALKGESWAAEVKKIKTLRGL